jgi:hypothetical protein
MMQISFLFILTNNITFGAEEIVDGFEMYSLHVENHLCFYFTRERALIAVEHIRIKHTMLISEMLL